MKKISYLICLCSFLPFSLFSEELTIQTLQSGSCWSKLEGEELKMASFKDKFSLQVELATIEEEALSQVLKKESIKEGDFKYSLLSMGLHCSGSGASFIVKNKVEDLSFCVWLKYEKESFSVRSIGLLEAGAEASSNIGCDGYVGNELLVGLKKSEDAKFLEKEGFAGHIESVHKITNTLYRLNLVEAQKGKEEEFMRALKDSGNFKYIELNLLQHHVGEFERLK